jgi:RIO-like serine/threonine protein kinase
MLENPWIITRNRSTTTKGKSSVGSCRTSAHTFQKLLLVQYPFGDHNDGWVHGDLRPTNLAVGADGAARIFDFTHARKTLSDAEAKYEFAKFDELVNSMQ